MLAAEHQWYSGALLEWVVGIAFALYLGTDTPYIRGDGLMAEEAGGTTESRTEDMHWGLLLRGDMQDLRQGLRQDMRDLRQEVQQDMRDFRQEVQQDLRVARQEVQQDLRGFHQDLTNHKSEVRSLVDNRFYWTIGIILTLFTMQSGLMVGLLKL